MTFDKPITNHLTGDAYSMVSADDSFVPSKENLQELVNICNEYLIYKTIFADKLKDKPYPYQKAISYFEWSTPGWKNKSYYNFVLLSPNNKICGNVDIKSNNKESAEIGYFVSINHKGIATNMVKELITFARSQNYKSLYASTIPGNDNSQNVLKRCGFKEMKEHKYKKDTDPFYLLEL